MSAVSNSVMPSSSALCTTARVCSASHRMPKLLHPRPTADTLSPELPSLRYSMIDPFLLSAMRQAAASCAPSEVFLQSLLLRQCAQPVKRARARRRWQNSADGKAARHPETAAANFVRRDQSEHSLRAGGASFCEPRQSVLAADVCVTAGAGGTHLRRRCAPAGIRFGADEFVSAGDALSG